MDKKKFKFSIVLCIVAVLCLATLFSAIFVMQNATFNMAEQISQETPITNDYIIDDSLIEYYESLPNTTASLAEADSTDIPSKYCLRDDYIIYTQDQDRNGLCWAFAGNMSAATTLMKATGQYYDFSEAWVSLAYSYATGSYTYGGGGNHTTYNYVLSLYGLVLESDMQYNNSYTICEQNKDAYFDYYSQFANKDIAKNLKSAFYNKSNKDDIKSHVYNYGSLELSAYWNSSVGSSGISTGTDSKTGSKFYYKCPASNNGSGAHAISIIGWDDEISFTYNSTTHTGAWLCLNSWGNSSGKEGLIYVAYDDTDVYSIAGYTYKTMEDTTGLSFQNEVSSVKVNDAEYTYTTNLKGKYYTGFSGTTNETKQKNVIFSGSEGVNSFEMTYNYSLEDKTNGLAVSIDNVSIFKGQKDITSNFSLSITTLEVANPHFYLQTDVSLSPGAYKIIVNYGTADSSLTGSYIDVFYIMDGNELAKVTCYVSSERNIKNNGQYQIYNSYNYDASIINLATTKTSGTVYLYYTPATYSTISSNSRDTNISFSGLSETSHTQQLTKNNVIINLCYINKDDLTNNKWVNFYYGTDGGVANNNSRLVVNQTDGVVLAEPTKSGYTFAGWYYDKDFTLPLSTNLDGKYIFEYSNGWCSKLYERHILGYNNTRVNVSYDDCNPFGMIAGDFGEITSLSKHTSKTATDSTIVAFNNLSQLFATFMNNFEIPTDGTKYIPSISSDALNSYTQFYNKAMELYNSSLVSFAQNVGNDLTSSAVIGVNHPYTMAFGSSISPELIDFQTVIANLFGFSSKTEFMNYAQNLANIYAQHRANIINSAATNEALDNGCFYTRNGSFVFPIAVKNELSSTVLAYVILDIRGLVSVWVNDITAALWATNFNSSYHTESIINNELYCKNILFVTGPSNVVVLGNNTAVSGQTYKTPKLYAQSYYHSYLDGSCMAFVYAKWTEAVPEVTISLTSSNLEPVAGESFTLSVASEPEEAILLSHLSGVTVTINWYKDGVLIATTNNSNASSGDFSFMQLEQTIAVAGNVDYYVQVVYVQGEMQISLASNSITISAQEPPVDPPSAVDNIDFDFTSGAFSWNAVAEAEGYLVVLYKDIQSSQIIREFDFGSDTTTYTLDKTLITSAGTYFIGIRPYRLYSTTIKVFSTDETCSQYVNYYEITYTSYTQDINSIIIQEGTSLNNVAPAAKTGYTFKYWCIDENRQIPFEEGSTVADNLTLYADWTMNDINNISTVADIEKEYDKQSESITISPVHESGLTNFSYVWYKQDQQGQPVVLDGETNNSISVLNVADSGTYFCKVTLTDADGFSVTNRTNDIVVAISKAVTSIDTSGVVTEYAYDGKEHIISSGAKLVDKNDEDVSGIDLEYTIADTEYRYTQNSFINVPLAGEFTLKIKARGNDNYQPAEQQVQITVHKADSTITVEKQYQFFRYTGKPIMPEFNLDNDEQTVVPDTQPINKGEYDITLTAQESQNYKSAIANVHITVNPANIYIKANDIMGVLFAKQQKLTYTIIEGEVYGNDDLGIELHSDVNTGKLGNYSISITSNNENYKIAVFEGNYRVTAWPYYVGFFVILFLSWFIISALKKRRYQYEFETNGGDIVSPIDTKSKGAITLDEPYKEGYKFVGWYTDMELTKPFKNKFRKSKGKTLYAKWEKIDGKMSLSEELQTAQEIVDEIQAIINPKQEQKQETQETPVEEKPKEKTEEEKMQEIVDSVTTKQSSEYSKEELEQFIKRITDKD